MTATPYPIEMHGSDRYTSLEEARRAALQPIAAAVARAIRAGIESGRYVVADGIVVLAGKSKPTRSPQVLLDTTPESGV